MKLCASSQFPFVCLGDCGEVVTGSTPPKANSDYWGGEIPFVTPAQLGFQPPITTADEYVTSEGADHGRLLPEGAVLVCCIGSLGKTGTAGVPLISNQQINAIIFDPIQVDARYGYHAARSLTPLLEHFAPSTTVKIVKKSAFTEFQIPLPPLAEQKWIAGILDAADALRAKRREALAQLDTLLQSTFLDMFGDPVTNPMGWVERRIDSVFMVARGGSPRPIQAYLTESDDGLNWIMIGDASADSRYITSTKKRIKPEGLSKSRMVHEGDFLLTNSMSFGKPYILKTEGCIHDGWLVLSPKDKRMSADFFYSLLSTGALYREFSKKAAGAVVKNLNTKLVSQILVPVPPLDLQQRFAAIVESVERQKARQRAHLADLDTLFASLQSRAFLGNL